MRKAWRTVAIYFGFADPDDSGPVEIHFVAHRLATQAAGLLVLAAAGTAIVEVALEWSSPWLGAAIGTLVFGVVEYVSDVRHSVPGSPVLRLPPGAEVVPARADWPWALKRLVIAVAALVPFILALGAAGVDEFWFIVPGQFLGMGLAAAVGAVRVARWEGSAGRRLARRETAKGATALYAVPRG